MRSSRIAAIAVAALFVTPSAFAQSQTPDKPATDRPQTRTSDTATTQTFTGCLMSEPDYRKAHNLGAGAAGGLGLGDEYVLVDVKVSPAKPAGAAEPPSGTSSASAAG